MLPTHALSEAMAIAKKWRNEGRITLIPPPVRVTRTPCLPGVAAPLGPDGKRRRGRPSATGLSQKRLGSHTLYVREWR
ncbi:MAG TPA: hypothetical protein VF607_02485, partial [Verrucomicrobiae bacterium]